MCVIKVLDFGPSASEPGSQCKVLSTAYRLVTNAAVEIMTRAFNQAYHAFGLYHALREFMAPFCLSMQVSTDHRSTGREMLGDLATAANDVGHPLPLAAGPCQLEAGELGPAGELRSQICGCPVS
jgi:hypothetical protein